MQVNSIRRLQALQVRLKVSKTDPFRVGLNVPVGHRQKELCPVVLAYMVARGAGLGPSFYYGDGRPLTRARLVGRCESSPHKAAGVDSSHYSGHSFRSGTATTAAERPQGISDATIMKKTPREKLEGVSKQLVTGIKIGGSSFMYAWYIYCAVCWCSY